MILFYIGSLLSIRINKTKESAEALRLHFKAVHLHSPCDSYPLNAYFIISLAANGGLKYLLYKSEPTADKNPIWKPFIIPLSNFFCSSLPDRLIQIDVYNNNINSE